MLRLQIYVLTLYFIFACISVSAQTADELSAEQIYEKVDNSVVVVLAYDNNGNLFQGSGVVLNSSGLIATNHHVCKDAVKIEIKHYTKEIINVQVLKFDEARDIILLKTADLTLTPVTQGSSLSLKTGQRVYAVGSPEGYENSISEGIISGFRTDENGVRLIQMTCPITDGSSGGAVLNSKGELIGLSVSGQHEGNLYFAIPVSEVFALADIELNTATDDTKDAAEYFQIGTIAKENKNYRDAEVYFSKYIEKFSNDVNAYYNRGYARFKLKEYKKAISDFSTVLEQGASSESYFYRGNCYYSLKDFKSAITDYTKAIEQEPDNYDIYYNRGYANFRVRNYSEAASDWQKTIDLNPEYENELTAKIKLAKEELAKQVK